MASSHGQVSRSVFATDLPFTQSELKVKEHFEDETNGGGLIENIASDGFGFWNTTMIVFKGKEVAKQVLEKTHRIKGTVVTVIPIQTGDESSTSSVVVTGLPRYTYRHDIKQYFEDKKHGGGSIKDITCSSGSWNSTIIEFQSEEVAHRVLEKYHEIFGATIKVIPFQSKGEMASSHGQVSRSVFATDLPLIKGVLKVKEHFEDETNGGGHIEHIASDAYGSWNTTMIEFEGKEVAKQVLEKTHRIKGTVVTVIPIQTGDESSISSVVVKDLPLCSYRHDIMKYFEDKKHGGGSIKDMTCTSSGSWNSTIIEFQSEEVAHRVLEKYHKILGTTVKVIPFQSKTTKVAATANRDLQAEKPRVPADHSILVTDLSQYTKEPIVKTYLEDKANGGGPVEDVIWQFNGKNTMIIVVFKDKEVTKSFVEKKHRIGYNSVQIFPLEFQLKHIFKSYDFEKGELTINDAWQKTLSQQQWMDVSHNVEGCKYQSGCYSVPCSFGKVTEVKNILQREWVKVIASVLTIEADTVNSDDGQSDAEVAASRQTTQDKPRMAKAGQDTSPLEEQQTYITSHDEGRQSRHDTGQGEGHDAARSIETYTTASNSFYESGDRPSEKTMCRSLDSSWSTLSLPQEVRESLGPNVKDKFIWGIVEKTRNHQVEKIKKMHHVSIRTITNRFDSEEILVEARSKNEPKEGSKEGATKVCDEVSTIHPEAQKKIDHLYEQIEQECSFQEVNMTGIEENMLHTALCEVEKMHTNVVISSNGQNVTLVGERDRVVSAKVDLRNLLPCLSKKSHKKHGAPGVAGQQAPPPLRAGGSVTNPSWIIPSDGNSSQSNVSVSSVQPPGTGEKNTNTKSPESRILEFGGNDQDRVNNPPNNPESTHEVTQGRAGDKPSSQDGTGNGRCANNQSQARNTRSANKKKATAEEVEGLGTKDDSEPVVRETKKTSEPSKVRVLKK